MMGRWLLAKAKRVGKKSTHFIIEVREGNLVVSLLNGKFRATYYKPPGRPNLILRERTKTDDEALVAEGFQAAVAKARELGWIVWKKPGERPASRGSLSGSVLIAAANEVISCERSPISAARHWFNPRANPSDECL